MHARAQIRRCSTSWSIWQPKRVAARSPYDGPLVRLASSCRCPVEKVEGCMMVVEPRRSRLTASHSLTLLHHDRCRAGGLGGRVRRELLLRPAVLADVTPFSQGRQGSAHPPQSSSLLLLLSPHLAAASASPRHTLRSWATRFFPCFLTTASALSTNFGLWLLVGPGVPQQPRSAHSFIKLVHKPRHLVTLHIFTTTWEMRLLRTFA